MIGRRVVFSAVGIPLVLWATACGQGRSSQTTPSARPPATATAPAPVARPTSTLVAATATLTQVPSTVPPTGTASGPAVVDVQFALEVDQDRQLVFPATDFTYGVTRVYLRFTYRGLEDVSEVRTLWYLNENLVSAGKLAWDGGESGDYIIWVEDPNGLGRGQWRWELSVDANSLGGGAFTIEGSPGYVNAGWGVSFDPPLGWIVETESEDFVSFSSRDRRYAVALRVAAAAADLAEASAADVALFQRDHPEAQVITAEETTMNGEKALLQQLRYTDQRTGEGVLFVVCAFQAGSAYSLWVLGPAEDTAALKTTLATTLHSIRFSTDE